MMYENYQKKIERRFYYKRIIFKYRILITSILALLSILTISYVATKGLVYGVNYNNEIVYGENINLSSKSIFSDTTYTYKNIETNEIFNEAPITPGSYVANISTKGLFGKIKTKSFDFVINKRDVSPVINDDEVEYGVNPLIDLGNDLVNGDTIKEVNYVYDDITKEVTKIEVDSIIIHNKKGEDVTSFYDFSKYEKEIKIVQRKITLSAKHTVVVYNGLEQGSNLIDVIKGSLANNDYIVSKTKVKESNVGRYVNEIEEISIFNENDIDVTNNYEIEILNTGVFEIARKAITLELETITNVYDGTIHTSDLLVSSYLDMLIDSHNLAYTTKGSIIDVGEVSNMIETYHIYDSNNNDVTSNYNVITKKAKLIVTKQDLFITTSSLEHVYNGLHVSSQSFEKISGLVETDSINHENIISDSYINVGTYENSIWYLEIYNNATKELVNNNYNVIYTLGQIKITKANIVITSPDINKVYDGTYYYNYHEQVVSMSNDLPDGYIYYVNNEIYNYIDVGIYENKFSVVIYDNNYLNVNHNFEIEYVFGELEITKRPVTIKSHDYTFIYDGKDQWFAEAYVSEGSLVNWHYISDVNPATTIKNVGTTKNYFEELRILDAYNGVNKFNNYDVTFDYGTLTVIKRDLNIKLIDINNEYNGLVHSTNEIDYEWNLVYTHEIIEIISLGKLIDIGYIENKIESFIIHDEFGEEVQDNYNLIQYYSFINVYQRSITIKTASNTKVYDDTLFSDKRFEVISETKPVVNDDINLEFFIEVIDVNYYDNIHTYTVYSNDRKLDVTSNYNIYVEYGLLTIEQRAIHIKPVDMIKVYDGTYLISEDYEYLENTPYKLVDGHELNLTIKGQIMFVSKDQSYIEYYKILKNNYEYKTSNYNVETFEGSLEITKRDITVKTIDITKVYDTYTLKNIETDYEIVSGSVAPTDYSSINQGILHNDAGEYLNNLTIKLIHKELLTYTTLNYNITYDYGKYIINKREVTIKPVDSEKIYDGKTVYIEDYEIVEGSLHDDSSYVSLEIETSLHVVNVGTYTNNQIIKYLIYRGQKENINHNYLMTLLDGTIIITKRTIEVSPINIKKEYNGLEHFTNEFEYKVDSLKVADTDTLKITTDKKLINVGIEEDNRISSYIITNSNNEDVTSNYIVSTGSGIIEVFKRSIIIKPLDVSKQYDGSPLTSNAPYDPNNRLVSGHYIVLETSGIQTEVGSSKNIITEYLIYNSNNEEVIDNYNVDIEDGKLNVIHEATLYIKLVDKTKVYDGYPLESSEFEYTNANRPLPGHTINIIDVKGTITNAGTEKNEIKEYVILDEYGNNITEYYSAVTIDGILEVTKKDIQITTGSLIEYYDAKEHSSNEIVVDKSLYPEVYDYSISNIIPRTNAGTYTNNLIVNLKNKNGDVITSNYNVDMIDGTITILKKEVTIELVSDYEYFNNSTTFENPEIYVSGIIDYEITIKIDIHTDTMEVGTNKYIVNFDVTELNETGKLENYEFYLIDKSISIEKLPVDIWLKNASSQLEYNGEYQLYDCYQATSNININSLTFKLLTTAYEKDAGVYDNQIKEIKEVLDSKGNNIINNLDINITNIEGDLFEIKRKEISFNVLEDEVAYDGNYHNSNKYSLSAPNGNKPLVNNHELIPEFNNYWYEMGIYENEPNKIVIKDLLGNDEARNYDITINPGEFIIFKNFEIRFYNDVYMYDGKEKHVSNEDYYLEEDLPNKYYISNIELIGFVKETFGKEEYKQQITYNKDSLIILDKEGNIVNKVIRLIEKTKDYITVIQRKVTIESADMVIVNIGDIDKYIQYVIKSGSFVRGHVVTYSNTNDISLNNNGISDDINVFENRFVVSTIIDEYGHDVTGNYDIKYIYGKIKVEG